MKIFEKMIFAGFFLLAGVAIGWVIKGKHLNIILSVYLPALATLFATYLGAKYAFDLHSNKEKSENKNKNIISGNFTIFNIIRMINSLINYKTQIIDPVRNKPSAFLEMRPTPHWDKNDISIKFEDLSFLLGMDDVNLLGELSLAEEKYKKALDAINLRSTIHLQEAQPKIELKGIKEGGDYSMDHLEKLLGNRLFIILKRSTQEVIEHVEEAIAYLESTGNKLNQILESAYPQEKTLSILMPENKE